MLRQLKLIETSINIVENLVIFIQYTWNVRHLQGLEIHETKRYCGNFMNFSLCHTRGGAKTNKIITAQAWSASVIIGMRQRGAGEMRAFLLYTPLALSFIQITYGPRYKLFKYAPLYEIDILTFLVRDGVSDTLS